MKKENRGLILHAISTGGVVAYILYSVMSRNVCLPIFGLSCFALGLSCATIPFSIVESMRGDELTERDICS